MNFLKRAFYSTKAKVGRSLLLTFVFSAILIFILAGLTIQSASLTAAENAKKSMGATVTLSANMENAMKEMQENTRDGERPDPSSFSITPIDLDDVEKITALDNLSSYSLSSTTTVNAKSFDAISSEDSSDNSDTEQQGGPGGMQMPEMASQGDISISGTNATATAASFTGGTAEIIDGVGITEADADSNKAVIETNLAEANGIAVGDTIKVKGDDKTYKLSVVGIYKSTESTDARSMQMASLNPYNTIYTSYTLANKVKGSDYKNTADSVVFNVTDPEKMDDFVKAAEATGLDTDTYALTTNDQVYQQMVQPLDNVKSFANKIVILVAVAGTVILALIVMLTIRERKYEIGVLMSLGEKRSKIIAQFFTELVFVLVIALVVAGVSGQFVGNAVGKQLIEQQTTTQTTDTASNAQSGPGMGGGQGGGAPSGMPSGGGQGGPAMGGNMPQAADTQQQIDDLDITLSMKELIELGGFGLGISFLAVIIASIGIMRMKPKKILIS